MAISVSADYLLLYHGQGFLNLFNFQTIGADMSLVLIMALGQTSSFSLEASTSRWACDGISVSRRSPGHE